AIVDVRALDHNFTVIGSDYLLARLAAAPPPASTSLRPLASDRLRVRRAHAFSRAGFTAARVGRKAPAVSYGPTSSSDDGGTAAFLARRAGLAPLARFTAPRLAIRAQVRFRFC